MIGGGGIDREKYIYTVNILCVRFYHVISDVEVGLWIVRHDQETIIKMTAVDVFVGNYTLIDFELYDLWLNGYTGKMVVYSESRIFAVESVIVYCRNAGGIM